MICLCFLHLGTHLISINMSCSLWSLLSLMMPESLLVQICWVGQNEDCSKSKSYCCCSQKATAKRGYKGSFIRKENHQHVQLEKIDPSLPWSRFSEGKYFSGPASPFKWCLTPHPHPDFPYSFHSSVILISRNTFLEFYFPISVTFLEVRSPAKPQEH